ncbi:TIGR00730 family Rossman fold protein [Liquorilactobacillus satsumensis]|uniref:LOG family protein n=1 Tax=Liquorilactobacillus satsumensis TaxID=259059 RepID=UPI001E392BAA|nr:TIGR00730 family Rossman fold protein [Liquorilactobacillus satsumensis]MCC7666932.1 TIGR00730 family Rossman fold protein [Liquorilactobacillus satsumensis]MCP9357214.1 TIGR00730 family Rossman fold protein [Liquorilactobacillus satsumensis]MCP9371161.1 TIGR00730 family Rossman fold protein [Liquorilactobacillus satsumensis]
MKKIAVYCGASTGNDPVYQKATLKLGSYLANHDLELVYGGGGVGLMGLLANEVLNAGGKVHGVMPKELVARGAAFSKLTDLKVVENMALRKQTMLSLADACLALPGGPGTLEEIIEAFSWARLGDNPNPCVFYNVQGYYDPLKAMFDEMTAKDFLTVTDRKKLLFSDSLTEIFDFMAAYVPPEIRTYSKAGR